MRLPAALFAATLLAGCGPDRPRPARPQAASTAPAAATPAQPAPADPAVQFLLAAAAGDFHAHRPPDPARFRGVVAGYAVAPDGARQWVLRGQFLPRGGRAGAEWTPFVTIKTSGYEQLLGAQAEGYCRQPSITWSDGEDLSSSLQSQLDSLR